MSNMTEHRLEYLTSPEVARYLQGSRLAILPVGCVEMHGPHVPLGCDTIHAYAMSVLLAEVWQCLVLPPIYYVYPGASTPWPGTIAVRPAATMAHIKEVSLAAIEAGFERLVILGTHGPLSFMVQPMIREIQQETGHIVLHMSPMKLMPDDIMQAELGYDRGEDILVHASAAILGLPDGLVKQGFADSPDRCFPFESMTRLMQCQCSMPWTFSEPWQHQPVRTQVKPGDGAKAADVMRRVARERYSDLPQQFEQFVQDMDALEQDAPWSVDRVAAMKPR